MTTLSSFTEEQRNLLIALPYQVGINISESDDAEGDEDDKQEERALQKVLGLIPSLYNHAPLTQEILKETSAQVEAQGASWKDGSFDVTRECGEAVALLKAHASVAEVKAYSKALLEIAETVARAAGEHAVVEIRQEPDTAFFKCLKGIMTVTGMIKEDTSANISVAEQAAIDKIADALRV
ncbi:MAG: hypothetical protein H6855_05730 [Rhodospirillales bacterium]|nr:hypothetical protein [Rhodospirillales bacterium]